MKKVALTAGIFMLFVQFLLVPVAEAKLYTWVDRTGKVRRTYYPPPANQVMQEKEEVEYSEEVVLNDVELYVTSWCPYCKQAINYFKSKGVPVKVYDIEKDRAAAARKRDLDNGGGVPFAIINGYYISGYSPESYNEALN